MLSHLLSGHGDVVASPSEQSELGGLVRPGAKHMSLPQAMNALKRGEIEYPHDDGSLSGLVRGVSVMPTSRPLKHDVNALDALGKRRFGETEWGHAIDAIGKAVGATGIPEQGMRQILSEADPAGVIMSAGKEALLQRSDAGDKEAEYQFAAIREKEREQHRKLKGRA